MLREGLGVFRGGRKDAGNWEDTTKAIDEGNFVEQLGYTDYGGDQTQHTGAALWDIIGKGQKRVTPNYQEDVV